MQNDREVIIQKKQYCMIDHTILSCQRNINVQISKEMKNVCVSLEKHSKIPAKHRKILKSQSCLKSFLLAKKESMSLFSYKKHSKSFFSSLFFSSFLNKYNIIYNIDIISNTKIKIINLVIKNYQICITKCTTKCLTFCKFGKFVLQNV